VNHTITERACRDCHESLAASIHALADAPDEVRGESTSQGIECTHCHRYVGHWVR
jgi:nitrate/TMAO reductase-like tetraheme cytochrome c subunit